MSRIESFLRLRLTMNAQVLHFFAINVFHFKQTKCDLCTAQFSLAAEHIVAKSPLSNIDIFRVYLFLLFTPHHREYFLFTGDQKQYLRNRLIKLTGSRFTAFYYVVRVMLLDTSKVNISDILWCIFNLDKISNMYEVLHDVSLAKAYHRSLIGVEHIGTGNELDRIPESNRLSSPYYEQ